jgi:hypothetical protein
MEGLGCVADFDAFGADGGGGGRFRAGGAAIQTARGVLGADYDGGDYAIVVGGGVDSFVATVCWNGARGHSWGDRG